LLGLFFVTSSNWSAYRMGFLYVRPEYEAVVGLVDADVAQRLCCSMKFVPPKAGKLTEMHLATLGDAGHVVRWSAIGYLENTIVEALDSDFAEPRLDLSGYALPERHQQGQPCDSREGDVVGQGRARGAFRGRRFQPVRASLCLAEELVPGGDCPMCGSSSLRRARRPSARPRPCGHARSAHRWPRSTTEPFH
jgi:hypothetical protein